MIAARMSETTPAEVTGRDAEEQTAPGDTGVDAHGHGHGTPTRLGRYALTERLGGGGMGVVYRAHDPELDRDVAIKLLRERLGVGSGEGRARMVREAQALARFSHPNVVQVFDVGTSDGRVWLAMELVEGTTLGRYLRSADRDRPEILRVFAAAGRGLAAAHAEGLVHRDFKPDNVFVGDDGRVRVGDFGLVRAASRTSDGSASASLDPPAPPSDDAIIGDLGATALTSAGFVLGTPAYMAPEQHLGRPTDARTDQFAWCIALWEALYGKRPFTGRRPSELARGKLMGPPPRPRDSDVPLALYRALARGLAPEPDDRFETMAQLLAAVESMTRPSRRLAFAAVGAVGLAAIVGAFVVRGGTDPCDVSDISLAADDDARRAAISQAFAATDLPYAAETDVRVQEALQAHADAWRSARSSACEAARRDGADTTTDARLRCLQRQRDRVDGVVTALEHADATIVGNAVVSLRGLADPATCLQDEAGAGMPMPEDPALRQAVAAVASDLERTDGLLEAGDHRDPLAQARAVLAAAEDTGFDPLLGRAEHLLARALEQAGRYDEAAEHFQRAWTLTTAGHDDAAAVDVGISLIWFHSRSMVDETKVREWSRHTEAALARAGDDIHADGNLALARGAAATSLGHPGEALAYYAAATEAFRRDHGQMHPNVATTLNDEGSALLALGRYAEARDRHEQALRLFEGELGPEHPLVATGYDNLANALGRLGDFEGASTARREALRIRRRSLGPDHVEVAQSLVNLAATLESAGEYAEAERTAKEAVALLESTVGAAHVYTGAALINQASAAERQGRSLEAIETLRRAMKILEATLPAEHPYLAFALATLGAAQRGAGQLDAAARSLDDVAARCDRDPIEANLCRLAAFERTRVRVQQAPGDDAALADARAALDALLQLPHAIPAALAADFRAWVEDPPTDADVP